MAHPIHVRTFPGTSMKTPQRSLFLPFLIYTQWMCCICCLLLSYLPYLFSSPSFDTQTFRRHWSTFKTEFWTLLPLKKLILDVSYTEKKWVNFLLSSNTTVFSLTFLPYLLLLCHACPGFFNAVRPDLLQRLTSFKCYSTHFITFT